MAEKVDRGQPDAFNELLAWIAEVRALIRNSSDLLAETEMVVHDPAEGLAYRERPLNRGAILLLVTDLVCLEHITNPRHAGMAPSILKDVLARTALAKAGFLLRHTIQWSVMHHAGLALSNTPVSMLPLSEVQSPAYIRGLERAGTHAHEIAGASWPETNPAAARSALATVIEQALGFWGPARALAEALRALDLGEVQPILRPGGKGKHGWAFTLRGLRLTALAFVEFRKGFRIKEEDARHEVAAALGVSPDTLSTWRKRLPVDEPKNRAALDEARVAGEHLHRLSTMPRLEPGDEQQRSAILEYFGPEALAKLASAYVGAVAEGSKKRSSKQAAS